MKGPRETWRRLTLRCAHCGHRFRYRRDPRNSYGGGDKAVYHSPCIAYLSWRRMAEERLIVLGTAVNLSGLDQAAISGVLELYATEHGERSRASNMVFRVFHDLGKLKKRDERGEK